MKMIANYTESFPMNMFFGGACCTHNKGTRTSGFFSCGDGSNITGKTASNTSTCSCSNFAPLTLPGGLGMNGTTTQAITGQSEITVTTSNMEVGEMSVGCSWICATLTATALDPKVVTGPQGFNNNNQPCVVHLRHINTTGFDIRLTEWNYLDGTHPAETVAYLVMEKGRTTLPNGAIVEAGTFAGTTRNQTIKFSKTFNKTPVVLTSVGSFNESDTISGRMRSITTTSFAYSFWEQEKNRNLHANETIHYIAWEPGKGTVGTVQFEIGKTANAMTNAWSTIAFQQAFQQQPLFMADMQTNNNTDTAALRSQNMTATSGQVKVEEEQSKDLETTHPAETVGYFALDKVEN